MKVYLNGKIVNEDEALIPIMVRGFLFGDGIFETIRLYQGKPFRFDRHLARFNEGCRGLRFSQPPDDRTIENAINELYHINVGEGDAYCRMTLTGGAYDGSKTLKRLAPPNLLIVVTPLEPYPRHFYEKGLRAVVPGIRRNEGSPLSRLKSTNYLNSMIAKQEAADRGADDAILLNNGDFLAEGTASNLFFVSRGLVMTPDPECGLLPGITRETVLELCAKLGLSVEMGFYSTEELLGADEAFLTVSTGEVVPVAVVEGSTIGEVCPGPITLRLSRAYKGLVQKELDI